MPDEEIIKGLYTHNAEDLNSDVIPVVIVICKLVLALFWKKHQV